MQRMRPFGRRDRRALANQVRECGSVATSQSTGRSNSGHAAAVERIGRDARPQHHAVRRRIARRHAERKRILVEFRLCQDACAATGDGDAGQGRHRLQPAPPGWIEVEAAGLVRNGLGRDTTPMHARPEQRPKRAHAASSVRIAPSWRACCTPFAHISQFAYGRRKSIGGVLANAPDDISMLRLCERVAYFARLIVNLPNEMPSSTPSPAPASASETVPLVMTWAVPPLTTPALASPCA